MIKTRSHSDPSHSTLEAAIAFAWSVSMCSLFLLHFRHTLQLHAAQRVVHGQMFRLWDPDRARTQAAFRAVASYKCHEVTSAQFSATATNATPEADAQQVGEGSGSAEGFHRTSGRRYEVREGEAAAKVLPLNVQISSTQEFICHSERHLAELEAERTPKAKLLEEARERLRQLEAAIVHKKRLHPLHQPPRWIWGPKSSQTAADGQSKAGRGMR